MLLIENKKGFKVYTIKNKYLCECGVLNEKGCYNHNIISWYDIKPYTCKEVNLLFYKDDYQIILTADNKKEMYKVVDK